MTELLIRLAGYPVMEILFALAVVLVLIDYFFPVDYPAFIGYLCFALGVFFAAPWRWGLSLVAAVATWALLLVLHRFGSHGFSPTLPVAPERLGEFSSARRLGGHRGDRCCEQD